MMAHSSNNFVARQSKLSSVAPSFNILLVYKIKNRCPYLKSQDRPLSNIWYLSPAF